MTLPLATLSDDVLRARLRRAATERMDTTNPERRALAGQACLEVITELQRRRAPLWRAPEGGCGCGCEPADQAPAAPRGASVGGVLLGGLVGAAQWAG